MPRAPYEMVLAAQVIWTPAPENGAEESHIQLAAPNPNLRAGMTAGGC
jgi:hypothetical protein